MPNETQPWEDVYVFISSTFNDMHAERDYLVKRVFPELSEWCEERRLRLVDIDLRWGVTEKDSQENKRVVDVCLRNIDRCRPLFVCFLGQRRGWVPGREDISEGTFEGFPKLADHIGSSVTEMEVIHALIDPMMNGSVLEARNRERAFFFLRDPGYLGSVSDQLVRNVYTNEGEADPALADEKLAGFKETVRSTGRPALGYAASWDEGASTPELLAPGKPESIARGRLVGFRCEGLPLSEVVIGQLKDAISEMFPGREPARAGTSLQRELDEQARFQQLASEGFIERVGDFDEIRAYLTSDDSRPCAVCAHAGLGKTSFLAQLIGKLRDAGTCEVLYRFVGTSESSVSAASLLSSIGEELSERFGLEKVPSEVQKLREALPDLLAKAAEKTGKQLVVIIDAVNQLDTGLDDLAWIPAFLVGDVKFIYSFKLGDRAGDDLHDEMMLRRETAVLQLRSLESRNDREALVEQFLSLYLKELDDDKVDAIVSSTGAGNPLFLKVLLSELRVFGSHEGLRDAIANQFGTTPLQAFDGLLRRFEGDPLYSQVPAKVLVANVFGWLSHSKNGLEPIELAEMLRDNGYADNAEEAADAVNLILRQLRPYLAKRDKRQDFYYESFLLAARARYEQPENGGKHDADWHRELVAYFEKRPVDDSRRLQELAFQYAHAGLADKLVSLLTSYAFMEARLRVTGVQGLVDDYSFAEHPKTGLTAEERDELALVREALEMAFDVLSKDTTQLPVQLHARLFGFEQPLISAILVDAACFLKERGIPWLKPLCACLRQPDGCVSRVFNTVDTAGLWFFKDRKRMLLCPQADQIVKVIEIKTGRILRTYSLGFTPRWICLIEELNLFIAGSTGFTRFVNLTTGEGYNAQGFVISTIGAGGSYYEVNALSADSGMVLSTQYDAKAMKSTIYVNEVQTGRLLHTFECREVDPTWTGLNGFFAAYDYDTGYLLLSNEEEGVTAYDPLDGFRIVRRYRNPNRDPSGEQRVRGPMPKYTRIYAPKGSPYLVLLTKYDGLTVFDKRSGEVLHSVDGDGSEFKVAISAERSLLAFAPIIYQACKRFEVYALDSFKLVAIVEVGGSNDGVSSLRFSERGDELFVRRPTGRTEVWDPSTWNKVGAFNDDDPRVNSIMTDASGMYQVMYQGTEVIVRKVGSSGQARKKSEDDLSKTRCFAFSPDDSFFIASISGVLYRIELPSFERKLLCRGERFVGWPVISYDARYFALDGSRKIYVHDCSTGELVGTVKPIDTTGTGHEEARQFRSFYFLPTELSLGSRNLTLMYEQWGCLVIQDLDMPDNTRVIRVFPGAVKETRLYDGGTKAVLISGNWRFDPEARAIDFFRTEDPSLPKEYKAYDLRTGECIEEFGDWKDAYLKTMDLDAHPVVDALVRSKEGPRELCRFQDRLLYYIANSGKSLTQPLIVRDDTNAEPLCWFTTDEFKYGSIISSTRDGKFIFIESNGFYPFSLENVLDVEPQPEPPSVAMPVRSEDALNQLGFVLSHKEDMNSMHESYLVYSELMQRFPKKSLHAKNRGIVERKMKVFLDGLGREADVESVARWYETYRELATAHPGDESFATLHGYAEDKLAFLLSHRDDIDSNERAAELYADLVERKYGEERNIKNLRITRTQIANLLRARGAEADDGVEDLQRAYDLYGELSAENPDREDFRKAQRSVEHKLAYRYIIRGKNGDVEASRRARDLYADLAEKEPTNEGVAKNLRIVENRLKAAGN